MLRKAIEQSWYQRGCCWTILLKPFAFIYGIIIKIRKWLYQKNIFPSYKLPVPVIIVGNIMVGGTGKTPLVIWLSHFLSRHGYKPAVISRGYGGKINHPHRVMINDDPKQVGDEALLLARRCDCPVIVNRNRVAAAKKAIADYQCNILISDDGLQHYALERDIQIAVFDGERRVGNDLLLPAGPLREPSRRIHGRMDFIVLNGWAKADEYLMTYIPNQVYRLDKPEVTKPLAEFSQQPVHAVAAIGNPERFFTSLEKAGLQIIRHAYPDHYMFQPQDLVFADDNPCIMTEKDAVKCEKIIVNNGWVLPVEAQLEERFGQQLLAKLHHVK